AVDDYQMPVGIDEAGVATPDPAVAERGPRGLVVLVVARERTRRPEQHLAALGHPQLDARQGRPDGLELHLPAAVERGRRAALGHPVELLEVHAEGAEELDDLGPERSPAGDPRAEPAEPELVAQRREDERAAEQGAQAQAPRHRRALQLELRPPHPPGEEEAREPPLEPAGVLEPHLRVGDEALPDPRWREGHGRSDLAE